MNHSTLLQIIESARDAAHLKHLFRSRIKPELASQTKRQHQNIEKALQVATTRLALSPSLTPGAWHPRPLGQGEQYILLPSRTLRVALGAIPQALPLDPASEDAENAALTTLAGMAAKLPPENMRRLPFMSDDPSLSIAGNSHGLPLVIARVSLWCSQAADPTVAGTAQVFDDGSLGPVEQLREKLDSLARDFPVVRTVVVAKDQPELDDPTFLKQIEPLKLAPVSSLFGGHFHQPGAFHFFFPVGFTNKGVLPAITKYLEESPLDYQAGEIFTGGSYVEWNGTPCDTAHFAEKILTKDFPSVSYIAGEFGSGKTLFCFSLLTQLCSLSGNRGAFQGVLPVLLRLQRAQPAIDELRRVSPGDGDALTKIIKALHLKEPTSTIQPPFRDKENPWDLDFPTVLIVDALDELQSDEVAVLLLQKLLRLVGSSRWSGKLKLVLSGRIHSIRSFSKKLRNDLGVTPGHLFQERENGLILRRLKPDDIERFVHHKIKNAEQQKAIFERIHRIPKASALHDLLSRPITLNLLLEGEPPFLLRLGYTGALPDVFSSWTRGIIRETASLSGAQEENLLRAIQRMAYTSVCRTKTGTMRASGVLTLGDIKKAFTLTKTPHHLRSRLDTFDFFLKLTRVEGALGWTHRMFRDFFLASHVAANIDQVILENKGRLDSTFCRLGLVDLLRPMLNRSHLPALLGCLKSDDRDARIFASHMLRSSHFADCLEDLKQAFQKAAAASEQEELASERKEATREALYTIFAILTHPKGDPEEYLPYLRAHKRDLNQTLEGFVEGAAADVREFDLRRLNDKEHRNKASIYLLSLSFIEVFAFAEQDVLAAIGHFLAHSLPSPQELQIAQETLAEINSTGVGTKSPGDPSR